MPIDILMPALSPTMEKGTLIQWTKSVGDKVRIGDLIAEVETDKATMDVEASADGVLSAIFVPAGTADVLVNIAIGAISVEGEISQPAPSSQANGSADVALIVVNGAGTGRIFASPIAKRLMAEAGIDPGSLSGTGPHGRILERDVKAALAEQERGNAVVAEPSRNIEPALASPASQLEHTTGGSDIRKLFDADSYDEVPHDAMRITIARRLTESKRTVPHFYVSTDCAIDRLLGLRKELNGASSTGGESGHRLSINDFVIKALALALRKVPDANVSFSDDAMLRHRHVDIGVAVAIPGGLLTPVIRKADIKTISAISNEVKELADRAKNRKLKPEEYSGGTASVSNLGMYGVKEFAAIINPPQATILAVGAAERRLVVNNDDSTSVASIVRVTLSADHRAVDGATAGQLLGAFKDLIENPLAILI